jgi:A/G-specific adenine glycosylase
MDVPSTAWRDRAWAVEEALSHAPAATAWRALPEVVRHGFTHFDLELTVLSGRVDGRRAINGVWCRPERLSEQALATLTKKVVQYALRCDGAAEGVTRARP